MQEHGCAEAPAAEVPGQFGTNGNGYGSADPIPSADGNPPLTAAGASGIEGPKMLDSLIVKNHVDEADVMHYDPINCKLEKDEIAPHVVSNWVKEADTPVNAGS
jgi:hypothetical protein